MIIQYTGKKPSLSVRAPYLSQGYDFLNGDSVEVTDDDGKMLTDLYPAIFQQKDCVIPDVLPITHEDNKLSKEEPKEEAVDDNDFTFEIDEATDSYLCPLCEKSYKTNKGRGRYALIGHLESVHAEQWAKMLQSQAAE